MSCKPKGQVRKLVETHSPKVKGHYVSKLNLKHFTQN